MRFISAALSLAVLISPIMGEIHEKSLSTSIPGMEALLHAEGQLTDNLETYAKDLQETVNMIRNGVADIMVDHTKSAPNRENYLSNPLQAFRLMRRMQSDWKNWEKIMASPAGEEQIKTIRQLRTALPTSNDVDEAMQGIHRLQVTYGLEPSDMAAGILNGRQYDARLSSRDCFAMGSTMVSIDKDFEAAAWLNTSANLYQNSSSNAVLHFNRSTVLGVYANCLVKLNRFEEAMTVLGEALTDAPHDETLMRRKADIEMLDKSKDVRTIRNEEAKPSHSDRGCRGEFPNRNAKLHCRYNSTTTPFLKLAPLKMEEIQLDPYMVLYHDVMTDTEMETLKEKARTGLERALIFNSERNGSEVFPGRTAHSYFITDSSDDLIDRILKRISDMTGFFMRGWETLQMANYGIGGHYSEHYDFLNIPRSEKLFANVSGDRIATLLFYLTDVEQGGATVFPRINTTIFPKKGTALLWYNLDNSGEPNTETLHVACPVLVGNKWVCTQWIHELFQFQRKPCYK